MKRETHEAFRRNMERRNQKTAAKVRQEENRRNYLRGWEQGWDDAAFEAATGNRIFPGSRYRYPGA